MLPRPHPTRNIGTSQNDGSDIGCSELQKWNATFLASASITVCIISVGKVVHQLSSSARYQHHHIRPPPSYHPHTNHLHRMHTSVDELLH